MCPGTLALHLQPRSRGSFCNYYIFSSFQSFPLTIMLPVLWVIFPILNYLAWIPLAWLNSSFIVNKPTVFKIYLKWCMHFSKVYSDICGFSKFILIVFCSRSLSVADFKLTTLLNTYSGCCINLLLYFWLLSSISSFPKAKFLLSFSP